MRLQFEPRSTEPFPTPSIELNVAGSTGERGLLLKAPDVEELLWDIETEIASARRRWRADVGGWWISASYYRTVLAIVLRSFPSVLVFGENEDHLVSRDGTSVLQERLL